MEATWEVSGWLASLDWGSVPDWIASVGTVGALLLGFGIVWFERRRSRREHADGFSTWYTLREASWPDNPKGAFHRTLIVSAHNGGSLPVPVAIVRSPASEPSYMMEFLGEHNRVESIPPGESRRKEIDLSDDQPIYEHVIVQFVDGKGRTWFRQLISGRYLSERRARGILGLNAWGKPAGE